MWLEGRWVIFFAIIIDFHVRAGVLLNQNLFVQASLLFSPPWENIISYISSAHGLLIFLTRNPLFIHGTHSSNGMALIGNIVFISMDFGWGLDCPVLSQVSFCLISIKKEKKTFSILLFLLKAMISTASAVIFHVAFFFLAGVLWVWIVRNLVLLLNDSWVLVGEVEKGCQPWWH